MCADQRFAKLATVVEKKMKTMEIVWRNPNPVPAYGRRHSFARTGERALYTQQEFVMDGQIGSWTRISDLEVVLGGRVALVRSTPGFAHAG
jgi:hypothetical protein